MYPPLYVDINIIEQRCIHPEGTYKGGDIALYTCRRPTLSIGCHGHMTCNTKALIEPSQRSGINIVVGHIKSESIVRRAMMYSCSVGDGREEGKERGGGTVARW